MWQNLRKTREEMVGKDVAGVPSVTREHTKQACGKYQHEKMVMWTKGGGWQLLC